MHFAPGSPQFFFQMYISFEMIVNNSIFRGLMEGWFFLIFCINPSGNSHWPVERPIAYWLWMDFLIISDLLNT